MKHALSIPLNLNQYDNNSSILESIPSIVYVNRDELSNDYIDEFKGKKSRSQFKRIVITTVGGEVSKDGVNGEEKTKN